MSKHESHEAHHATPHDATSDVATAARTLYQAAERLGPRVTAHGPGCPANAGGGCTCGATDFVAAMQGMGIALGALKPQNGD